MRPIGTFWSPSRQCSVLCCPLLLWAKLGTGHHVTRSIYHTSISQCVQLLFIAQLQFPQNLHRTSHWFHLFSEIGEKGVYPSASASLHLSSVCVCVLFVCERLMTCLLVEGSSCALDLVCVALPCPVIASRLLAAAKQPVLEGCAAAVILPRCYMVKPLSATAVSTVSPHSCVQEYNHHTHRQAASPRIAQNLNVAMKKTGKLRNLKKKSFKYGHTLNRSFFRRVNIEVNSKFAFHASGRDVQSHMTSSLQVKMACLDGGGNRIFFMSTRREKCNNHFSTANIEM